MRFVRLLLAVIALAAAAPALAQKKAEAPARAPVKFPVWVEEADGGFWREGKRQSFKVFLDEKETPIRGFQDTRSGAVMLVVFDTVADPARVDEARAALGEALKGLGENYWIGLLRAQDGLTVLQEPTADRAALGEKMQAIQVSGKAGLLDTLEPASRLAAGILQKAAVRLSVLYITDGGIGHYRADYLNPVINASDAGDLSRRFSDRAVQERTSRLAESLAAFTVPLFVLHLERRGDALNLAYQSGLERIASNSGGAAVFCRTADEIKPSLAGLVARLRASYFLTLDPPPAGRKSARLRVATDRPGRVIHPAQLALPKKK